MHTLRLLLGVEVRIAKKVDHLEKTPKALLEHLRCIAPLSHLPDEDPTPQYHTSSSVVMEIFCCPICTRILNQPLQISCGAVICLDCCCKWIQLSPSLSCPCCYSHSLGRSTLNSPSPLITSLLNDLLINCKRNCMKIVCASQYKAHHLQIVRSISIKLLTHHPKSLSRMC